MLRICWQRETLDYAKLSNLRTLMKRLLLKALSKNKIKAARRDMAKLHDARKLVIKKIIFKCFHYNSYICLYVVN